MGGGPCSLLVGSGAQPSSLSMVGRCRHLWMVVGYCQCWWGGGGPLWALVVGRCGRWWWAVIGVGGGPSLALIGGSSLPVMSPGVAASNRRHAIVVCSSPVLAVWLSFPSCCCLSSSVIVVHRYCVIASFCRRCVVPL